MDTGHCDDMNGRAQLFKLYEDKKELTRELATIQKNKLALMKEITDIQKKRCDLWIQRFEIAEVAGDPENMKKAEDMVHSILYNSE
jgi:hypothetical protein